MKLSKETDDYTIWLSSCLFILQDETPSKRDTWLESFDCRQFFHFCLLHPPSYPTTRDMRTTIILAWCCNLVFNACFAIECRLVNKPFMCFSTGTPMCSVISITRKDRHAATLLKSFCLPNTCMMPWKPHKIRWQEGTCCQHGKVKSGEERTRVRWLRA